MPDPHSIDWQPITDLPGDWRDTHVFASTHARVEMWKEQAEELQKKDLFQQFLDRLRRQWAIETGVIEGLYDVNEAGTKTLIEKGLDAALLSHDDTDLPKADVVAKIKDQHDALMGLYQFVSGERPLGTSYIKELHQVLTANQKTYHGRDTLGREVEPQLPRGVWKKLPNNVEHADGTIFAYCPPEHVASEMDRLIDMHLAHVEQRIPPDVEAAWLHHRFTLIHPFTDGNGRVARCLATLVLLKEHWLPLVVTRDDRDEYIAAIRKADRGDLESLVDLIGLLQKRAIREATSLADDVVSEDKAVSSILAAVKQKFGQQRKAKQELVETSFGIVDSLHHYAQTRLNDVADEITSTIQSEGPHFQAWSNRANRHDENSYFFYHQMVQCAKQHGYFADRSRYQAWARLVIQTRHRTEILFSFHGIGHETAGVLGCSAMAYTRDSFEETTDGAHTETVNGYSEVTRLSSEPFEFVYTEDGVDVQKRFRRWMEDCIVAGLDYWQKSI